jgi:hypothetical protein
MSKRFRDFGSGDSTKKDPVVFRLYDEEFTCKPSLQGRTLLNLVASTGGSENPSEVAASIERFFEVCLSDDSRERFFSLLDDPERVVSVEMLGEITSWLVEEYSGRPTQGSED